MQNKVIYIILSINILINIESATAQSKVYRISEEEATNQKLFLEATSQKLLGKYEKAAQLFAELLKKDDTNAAAAYELARMMEVQNKDSEALKAAQTAVALDKKNVWYKMLLADLYQKKNQHAEAAKIYELLAADEPNNEDYYYGWANCLEQLGDAQRAIKIYDQLEKRRGVGEDLSRRKHALYLTLKNTKKATEELEKLTVAFPSNVIYLRVLADFYQQQNDTSNVRAVCERILRASPNDAYATMTLARGNRAVATNEVAYLQSLRPLFEKKEMGIDVKIKELIPTAQKLLKNPDNVTSEAAINLVKILERVHPDEAKIYALYGDLLFANNEKMVALAQYKKALSLNKNIYPVWEQAMMIELELADYEQLTTTSAQAIEFFPNQATPYFLNGKANVERKKYAEADESLQQALVTVGKNQARKADVFLLLGKSAFAQKKYEKAKDFLTKNTAISGENEAEVLEIMGDTFSQLSDTDNALIFWKKAQLRNSKSINLSKKIADKKYSE